MTKTLEIDGREAAMMLNRLSFVAYEADKKIDEINLQIFDAEYDGEDTEMLKVKRQQKIDEKAIAEKLYRKIKKLGLVF